MISTRCILFSTTFMRVEILKLVSRKKSEDRQLIHTDVQDEDIFRQTEQHIQMKIMKRFYGKQGDLKLISRKKSRLSG